MNYKQQLSAMGSLGFSVFALFVVGKKSLFQSKYLAKLCWPCSFSWTWTQRISFQQILRSEDEHFQRRASFQDTIPWITCDLQCENVTNGYWDKNRHQRYAVDLDFVESALQTWRRQFADRLQEPGQKLRRESLAICCQWSSQICRCSIRCSSAVDSKRIDIFKD